MRENLDPILTDPDFLALPPEQDFLSQFRTMDTVPEEEAQWLVPGYIPQGQITLLAADGGVGKTRFWCQLLAALSTGCGSSTTRSCCAPAARILPGAHCPSPDERRRVANATPSSTAPRRPGRKRGGSADAAHR